MNSKGKNILRRLLLRDVSAAQLVLYAIGVYLGLLILTGALQLWRDFSCSASGNDSDPFASESYVILSPRVEGLDFGRQSTDSDMLLSLLRSQPWVLSADRFSAADFSVTASVDFGNVRFASALFFEAVPDKYLQPLPDGWAFDSDNQSAYIPIILPRDYLALYNFGFAPSQGLPSLGEEVIKQIPLTISVAGNGMQHRFAARIVGFSNRINTIAVPKAFISWANGIYGESVSMPKGSSRLIAHLSTDPADPAIREFAASHSLDIAGDEGNVSPSRILAVILAIVSGIGLLLCILSVAILTVSLFLLLYKSRQVIVRLISIGFTQKSVVTVYSLLLATINAIVWVACTITLVAGHKIISPLLDDVAGVASILPAVAVSFLFMLFIQLMGMVVIKMKTNI